MSLRDNPSSDESIGGKHRHHRMLGENTAFMKACHLMTGTDSHIEEAMA